MKWEKTGSWAVRLSLRLNVSVTFAHISFLGSRLLCPGQHSASRCRIHYCHFHENDSPTYTHAFSTQLLKDCGVLCERVCFFLFFFVFVDRLCFSLEGSGGRRRTWTPPAFMRVMNVSCIDAVYKCCIKESYQCFEAQALTVVWTLIYRQ